MSHLFICVHELSLVPIYKNAINIFNESLTQQHRDSGFDLYTAFDCIVKGNTSAYTLDTLVSCAVYDNDGNPLPYYMFPRSSISKTPLRLANSVGIIDSGYRGHLMGKVDNISTIEHNVMQHTRLFQLCSHNLLPFKSVSLVSSLDDTKRGSGCFGSTGK